MQSAIRSLQLLPNSSFLRSFSKYLKPTECIVTKNEQFKKTPSGIKYKDIKVGTGKLVNSGDIVHVHHKGRFLNGKPMAYTSYDIGAPLSFKVGEGWVIPAWDETIIGMREGGKRKVIATPDVAYGEKGARDIPPNSTIVFELEVVGTGMEPLLHDE